MFITPQPCFRTKATKKKKITKCVHTEIMCLSQFTHKLTWCKIQPCLVEHKAIFLLHDWQVHIEINKTHCMSKVSWEYIAAELWVNFSDMEIIYHQLLEDARRMNVVIYDRTILLYWSCHYSFGGNIFDECVLINEFIPLLFSHSPSWIPLPVSSRAGSILWRRSHVQPARLPG